MEEGSEEDEEIGKREEIEKVKSSRLPRIACLDDDVRVHTIGYDPLGFEARARVRLNRKKVENSKFQFFAFDLYSKLCSVA